MMHMNSTWLFYLVLREKSIQGIRNTHFIRLKKKTISVLHQHKQCAGLRMSSPVLYQQASQAKVKLNMIIYKCFMSA